MLQAGQIVDRFTVQGMIGEGGTASVWKLRHNTLGSSHALKLLKVDSSDIRWRLVTQGRLQATLRHPNVVAVTDVVFVGHHPGLLMELVEGPTLEDLLAERSPTLEEVEHLFDGILAGVDAAHRAGLVHRDLKPANVLLDASSGTLVPKVTDFGLAKILEDEQAGCSQTQEGIPMGTPQFMAPEQIRSGKDVDRRADVFALGCILYHMVCGERPFDGPDILAIYNDVTAGRFTPPELIVPDLPPRFRNTIVGCLRTDRDRRIPDCDEIRRCLFEGAPPVRSPASLVARRPRSPIPGAPRPEADLAAASPAFPEMSPTSPSPPELLRANSTAPAPRSGPPVPGLAVASDPPDPPSRPEASDTTPSAAPTDAPVDSAPASPLTLVGARLRRVAQPSVHPVASSFASVALGVALWLTVLLGAHRGMTWILGAGTDDGDAPTQHEPRAFVSLTVPPNATYADTVTTMDTDTTDDSGVVGDPALDSAGSAAPPASPATPRPTAHTAVKPPTAAVLPPVPSGAGALVVKGDAEGVVLAANGQTFAPGPLSPGIYAVTVTFPGHGPRPVGNFTVRPGETTTVVCDGMWGECR